MAYNSTKLSVLSYANDFTHWVYHTNDSLEEIISKDYFNQVYPFIRTGDFVNVNTPSESAILVLSVVGTDKVNSVVMCQAARE